MIKDPQTVQAIDLARTKDGIWGLAKNGGEIPDYAVTKIHESGASGLLAYPNILYGYFNDPDRLGLPNLHVSHPSKLEWY